MAAGPPMATRVCADSGASGVTVKLGISARRASVWSIDSIIEEAVMRSGFSGFPAEAMTFYRGLARNNTREWFQPRKHIYDGKVKAPMVELVTALNHAMMEFA